MSNTNTRGSRITLRPIAPSPKVGFPMPQAKLPASSNITLERWLDIWMEKDIEPCRADTTIHGYDSIIQNHICPALGKVRLADLSPELLNGYYQWLAEGKGLSPNTIRKHHILLHTALKSAFRQGVIAANPVQRATPPPAAAVEVTYYTPARLSELLRAVQGDPLELPVSCWACAGGTWTSTPASCPCGGCAPPWAPGWWRSLPRPPTAAAPCPSAPWRICWSFSAPSRPSGFRRECPAAWMTSSCWAGTASPFTPT